jgi:hypothetical protein
MAEYVKCKYCIYCNTSERSGYKCYCEWYKIYVDPDEVSDCSHYRD